MDEIAAYNKERWEELSAAGIEFGRPWLDLTPETAYSRINPQAIDLDVSGKDVLCLAASGGQQSAAFGLLGAAVTVFDLSETQLSKDQLAADHYGNAVTLHQGDMRDLSVFDDDSFDIVWHAHSVNFVPDFGAVIRESVRVLRPGGHYRTEVVNPYSHGVDERCWNGEGYLVSRPYVDEQEIVGDDHEWDVWREDGSCVRVRGPHEYRHTLTTVFNTLIVNRLRLIGLWEETASDPNAEPGSWDHLQSILPPWFTIWTWLEKTVDDPR